MPQNAQTNMKGTSPSKLIQGVVNSAWGQQTKVNTNAQAALAQKHTSSDAKVNVGGKK